ncbi:hypothetical protein WJX79_008818 [Trebouxia sp. C0005]
MFTESAKHSLAKVIVGYSPNYTHDPAVHFASDSDSEENDNGLRFAATTPTLSQQQSVDGQGVADKMAQLWVDSMTRLVACLFALAYHELTVAMVVKFEELANSKS